MSDDFSGFSGVNIPGAAWIVFPPHETKRPKRPSRKVESHCASCNSGFALVGRICKAVGTWSLGKDGVWWWAVVFFFFFVVVVAVAVAAGGGGVVVVVVYFFGGDFFLAMG